MPVIGRLDGQVDDILISPISRRQSEEELPPSTKNEETPEPQTPPPTHTQTAVESSADADELPVWLL